MAGRSYKKGPGRGPQGATGAQGVAGSSATVDDVTEDQQLLIDVTTQDVTTSKHGYTPKAPNDATKFLRGDATWAVPSGSGGGGGGSLANLTTPVGNGADTTEDTLFTYTMPANTMDTNGDVITIKGVIFFAQNTNVKAFRLYFGSVVLGGITGFATSAANNVMLFEANVIRTGSATQANWMSATQGASTLTTANSFMTHSITMAEDLTASVVIKITGQSGTAAANNIVCRGTYVYLTSA